MARAGLDGHLEPVAADDWQTSIQITSPSTHHVVSQGCKVFDVFDDHEIPFHPPIGGNETKATSLARLLRCGAWCGKADPIRWGARERVRAQPCPVIPRFPSGFDPCGEPRREVAFTNLPPGLRRRPAVASTPAPPPPRRRLGPPPRGSCAAESGETPWRRAGCPSSNRTTRARGRSCTPAFQAGKRRRPDPGRS